MSRLDVTIPGKAEAVVEQLYRNMERRIAASPPGLCPVALISSVSIGEAEICSRTSLQAGHPGLLINSRV